MYVRMYVYMYVYHAHRVFERYAIHRIKEMSTYTHIHTYFRLFWNTPRVKKVEEKPDVILSIDKLKGAILYIYTYTYINIYTYIHTAMVEYASSKESGRKAR